MQTLNKWDSFKILYKEVNRTLGIDILNKTRKREYVYARFIFINKLFKNTEYNYTLSEISRLLNKNHATVIHAQKQYDILKNYPDFQEMENSINRALKSKEIAKLNDCVFEIKQYR
jgi:chromosomal replication initiation ATPase DnaA